MIMTTATCRNPDCTQIDIVKGMPLALEPDEPVHCGTCMSICELGEQDIPWPAALTGLEPPE